MQKLRRPTRAAGNSGFTLQQIKCPSFRRGNSNFFLRADLALFYAAKQTNFNHVIAKFILPHFQMYFLH